MSALIADLEGVRGLRLARRVRSGCATATGRRCPPPDALRHAPRARRRSTGGRYNALVAAERGARQAPSAAGGRRAIALRPSPMPAPSSCTDGGAARRRACGLEDDLARFLRGVKGSSGRALGGVASASSASEMLVYSALVAAARTRPGAMSERDRCLLGGLRHDADLDSAARSSRCAPPLSARVRVRRLRSWMLSTELRREPACPSRKRSRAHPSPKYMRRMPSPAICSGGIIARRLHRPRRPTIVVTLRTSQPSLEHPAPDDGLVGLSHPSMRLACLRSSSKVHIAMSLARSLSRRVSPVASTVLDHPAHAPCGSGLPTPLLQVRATRRRSCAHYRRPSRRHGLLARALVLLVALLPFLVPSAR